MPPKKKPKTCGNCSTTETTSWHRQRGNNKFFCANCQAQKLLLKQSQSSTSNSEFKEEENVESENPSTPAPTARTTSSDSSPELGGENPEPRGLGEESAIKMEITEISGENQKTDQDQISDQAKTDEKGDQSKIDRPSSPSSTKQEETNRDFVKKQKSPISHPRLTRLRSAATRPVRQTAATSSSATKTQTEKPEKQSHSRSSSAAGGNFSSSKSTGGSSISLSGIGSSGLVVPRHKGRRHIFKLLKPEKATSRRATTATYDSLWHKGQLFRQGDVVAVVDEADGNTYYGMIQGLLRDEYCQQFAVLTWLVPTDLSPRDRSFDPISYMQGPEDEALYPLDGLEFVCHLDNDYFKRRGATVSSLSTMLSRAPANPSSSLNPQVQFAGMA